MQNLLSNLGDTATPFLAIDVDVMDRNLSGMAEGARQRGLVMRPHAKTHKVPEIARRQMELGAAGLTLATVGEAEVFASAGFNDLFIAYPIWATPARGARLRALTERVIIRVGIDSIEGAQELGRALSGTGLEVMVEVDSGHHRSGAQPEAAGAVAVAAARAGLNVAGVFTFPGHGYAPGGRDRAAKDEAEALARAAAAVERAGIAAPIRSGGSTPTVAMADTTVLTEMRPGVYVFNDAQQVELGSCAWSDIALTAVSTVVSRSGQTIVLDAGSKVLGADQPLWVTGGGRLPDFPQARVVALSEHHATVRIPDSVPTPSRGDIVRIAPNHVCSAVNLADELVVTKNGIIIDQWVVAARGANT